MLILTQSFFTLFFVPSLVALIRRLIQWNKQGLWSKGKGVLPRPPTITLPAVTMTIPVAGHLLAFVLDTYTAIDSIIQRCNGGSVHIKLIVKDFYLISGHEAIKTVWRSRNLHTRAYKTECLYNMFRNSRDWLNMWLGDDSGHNRIPHRRSHLPAHRRVDYLVYGSIVQFFTGSSLKNFASRFTTNMIRLRTDAEITISTVGWSPVDDFFEFFQEKVLQASITAMCGEHILRLNPDFTKDFCRFDRDIWYLAKGFPAWLYPSLYRAQTRCLEAIDRWHGYTKPYIYSEPWPLDYSPHYGAHMMRLRHLGRQKAELISRGDDLAIIWASNGNSLPAAFWMLAHVLHRPHLRQMVQDQFNQYRKPDQSHDLGFDLNAMCTNAILQAIYAEVLRVYTAPMILRSPDQRNLKVGSLDIPRDTIMMISSYHAHMDSNIWSRQVYDFRPERFLFHGDGRPVMDLQSVTPTELTSLSFSTAGRETSWFPYGGGQHMCPGRHFAKLKMIATTAIMMTMYEIELLDDDLPKSDLRKLGFGTMGPKSRLRARVRRAAAL